MTDILHDLIGFFDILGYQSILKKNKTEDKMNAVVSVLEIINGIENTNLAQYSIYDQEQGVANSMDHLVKRLIFSDTIILSLDFSDLINKKRSKAQLWLGLTQLKRKVQLLQQFVFLPHKSSVE